MSHGMIKQRVKNVFFYPRPNVIAALQWHILNEVPNGNLVSIHIKDKLVAICGSYPYYMGKVDVSITTKYEFIYSSI